MAWTIEENRSGLPWAQWVDLEAFGAWQRRLELLWALPVSLYPFAQYVQNADVTGYVRLGMSVPRYPVTPARVQSYRGLEPWVSSQEDFFAGQAGFARDVLTCCAMMLRALNQPAFACPSYVYAYRGRVGTRDVESGLWSLDGVYRREAVSFIDGTSEDARRSWEGDGQGYSLEVYQRLSLTAQSEVAAELLFARHPPTPPAQSVFSPGPAFVPSQDVTTALTNLEPGYVIRWPPPGGAERVGAANYLVSLAQNWELLNALVVGGGFLSRTAREFVNRSRIYAVLKNVREARRFGGRVPEDLVTASAAAESMRWETSDTSEQFRDVMGQIGRTIGGLNPIAGAAVQGLGMVPEIMEALGGRAIARTLDEFGRVEPVYESTMLGGTIARVGQTRPPFTVPEAPEVDSARYPLTVPRVPLVELPRAADATGASGGTTSGAVSMVGLARRLWGLT